MTRADALEVRLSDGAVLAVRVLGPRGATRLYLSHGNGLAIDGYRVFWEPWAERYELVLFDVRNHGRNPCHGAAGHNWQRIAADFPELRAATDAALGEAPLSVGVFHSLSAVAAASAAPRSPGLFDALVLFDPPLPAPPGHPAHPDIVANNEKMARWASRRPARFAAPEELAASFAATRSLQRWRPGTHLDMARAVLREEAGSFVLACPPALEAHIYRTNDEPGLWEGLGRLPCPALIVGADTTLPEADSPARLCKAAAEEFGLGYVAIPGTTHFLQIERPEECRAAVERFLS